MNNILIFMQLHNIEIKSLYESSFTYQMYVPHNFTF